MSRVVAVFLLILLADGSAFAQAKAKPAKAPKAAVASTPAPEKAAPDKPVPTPSPKPPGPAEPIVTKIDADEAFFDSNKHFGIFTGHVKVTDPRFNIQSDKLTVYIHKEEGQGLEKAVAEGNVGVVRDRPDPNGGPPTRSVGRSDMAVYTAKDGNVELTGNPRVQLGMNTHVAVLPTTVMILNENGQLVTHGPSRTEIRQEAKDDKTKKP